MPFPDTSPYDILELSPSARLNDMMRAYQEAVRRRRYPAQRILQALNDLKNPRTRAAHDLLTFSNLGDTTEAQRVLASLPPARFISPDVTPLPLALGLNSLPETVEEDVLDVPGCPFELQHMVPSNALLSILPLPPVPA